MNQASITHGRAILLGCGWAAGAVALLCSTQWARRIDPPGNVFLALVIVLAGAWCVHRSWKVVLYTISLAILLVLGLFAFLISAMPHA